jgi:SAM-dependent methyltransferase
MTVCPICSAELPPPAIGSPDRLHPGGTETFAVAVCGTCGAGTTLPRVGPDELAAFYPAGYGPHEAPNRPIVALISRGIRAWQDALSWRGKPLRVLRDRPAGRGLDIGAGRGNLSAMLEGHGWRMTAVEPSPAAAAAARAQGIEVREGVLATVELEPAAYDLAVFQHALEHTIDPTEDLRRLHAAMRPGGLVVISVPNFGCWQRRRFGGAWFHLDVPRHRIHFTADSLSRALRAAGFEVRDVKTSSSTVGLWATLQYRVFGRCLFPAGLQLRVAAGLCALGLPVALVADSAGGGGDVLHAVAKA